MCWICCAHYSRLHFPLINILDMKIPYILYPLKMVVVLVRVLSRTERGRERYGRREGEKRGY